MYCYLSSVRCPSDQHVHERFGELADVEVKKQRSKMGRNQGSDKRCFIASTAVVVNGVDVVWMGDQLIVGS